MARRYDNKVFNTAKDQVVLLTRVARQNTSQIINKLTWSEHALKPHLCKVKINLDLQNYEQIDKFDSAKNHEIRRS